MVTKTLYPITHQSAGYSSGYTELAQLGQRVARLGT